MDEQGQRTASVFPAACSRQNRSCTRCRPARRTSRPAQDAQSRARQTRRRVRRPASRGSAASCGSSRCSRALPAPCSANAASPAACSRRSCVNAVLAEHGLKARRVGQRESHITHALPTQATRGVGTTRFRAGTQAACEFLEAQDRHLGQQPGCAAGVDAWARPPTPPARRAASRRVKPSMPRSASRASVAPISAACRSPW